MAVISELLVELGFDYDDKQAKAFEKRVGSMGKAVAKIAMAVGATAVAMAALTVANARTAEGISDVSKMAGVSVRELNAMRQALSTLGMSAEDADAMLVGINAALKGFDPAKLNAIRSLGIDTEGKNSAQVMLEAVQALSKYSGKELEVRAGLIGFDPIQINQLLSDPNGFVAKFQAAFDSSASEKTIKSLSQLSGKIKDFIYDVKQLTAEIANGLTPILDSLMDDFFKWVTSNKDLIINNVKAYSDAMRATVDVIAWVVEKIAAITDPLTSMLADASVAYEQGGWKEIVFGSNTRGLDYRAQAGATSGGTTNITMTNNVNGVSDPRLASELTTNKIISAANRGRLYATE